MTPQFTTPCFVFIEDKDKQKEICDKLEPIGYKIKVDYTDDLNPIIVASKLGILYDASRFEGIPEFINCGTNTDLFLALAGMRSDTDLGQWFVHEKRDNDFVRCSCHEFNYDNFRRATAAEIIKHFKK